MTGDLGPEQWQRLEELFLQASELPASQRDAFLERSCSGDEELRAGVEELIAAEEDSEARIERAVRGTFELAVDELGESESRPATSRIGPYQILREIGRGGMGTVYLAERDDEHYHQRVAVKVVRRGPDSEELRRRLRQERQILANLDHPHIARLLDGGNTDDGTPYFVAEYVEGEPIDRYCDRRGLSVTERLELFSQVCAAVQYAHRNLVIHRDLKPSNLLVTGEGVPKLLDFGIAKLIDPATPQTAATITGLSLLTPDYASPEQVRGEPLSTATDVYSLGVLLYELLASQHPYQVDRGSQLELLKAICEIDPERPSVALSRAEKGSDASDVDRRRRRLRGDLDNIVLRALHKQPERRYPLVDQLAEDVRRHLSGLPVAARGDAFGYRLAKFLSRNRVPVAGVAFALLAIVALVSFYTVRLAAERDRALRKERESAQVVDFVRELFENADPGRSRGEEITARELLDQGAERIAVTLDGQPEVQAKLTDLMGTIYTNLGLYDQAGELLASSMGVRRRIYGDEHSDVATSLYHHGMWLRETGQYEQSKSELRQALEMRERLLGSDHPRVADSLNALADLLYDLGELDTAEALFRRSLKIRQGAFGPEHPDVATSLNNLGGTLNQQGKSEAAEPLLRRALALRRRLLGDRHADVAVTLNTLAATRLALKDFEEAQTLYLEALEIRRQVYEPMHPKIGLALNNLGELMRRRKAYQEAEPFFREALEISGRRQGEQHPDFAVRLTNLADTLRPQGKLEAAEALYRQALEIALVGLAWDHHVTASIWMKLGDTRLARGDAQEAESCYREILRARRSNPPTEAWKLSTPMVRLGEVLLARADAAGAVEILSEALEVLHRELPGDRRTVRAEELLQQAETLLASAAR